jgi:lipoxygenase homology domain-containing protein 1
MSEPIYSIWVTTGTEALGGTDSNVYMMLFGANGQTDWVYLPPKDIFAFEEGSTDKFMLDVPDLGALTRCCVAHDASADSGWFVEGVRVKHNPSGQVWNFTFHQWVGDEEAGRRSVCADA